MSDEEYEQCSDEQKLNIANYFVQSSPPGEVHEVLIDVAKLVNDAGLLTDDKIKEMLMKYNVEQLQTAKAPSGEQVCVSEYGAVGDGEYVDPATGKVLAFDHRKMSFTGETDKKQSLDAKIGEFRQAIDDAMNKYISQQYKKGKCVVTTYGADDGAITVCLSAKNVHLAAFWSGGWRATFKLNVTSGSTVECDSKVHVHYFEDGNVQLNSAISKSFDISVTTPEETAAAVVKAVGQHESSYQSSLEEMYVDMHRSTFKKMRRFLPITKAMMNWNVYAHSLKN